MSLSEVLCTDRPLIQAVTYLQCLRKLAMSLGLVDGVSLPLPGAFGYTWAIFNISHKVLYLVEHILQDLGGQIDLPVHQASIQKQRDRACKIFDFTLKVFDFILHVDLRNNL